MNNLCESNIFISAQILNEISNVLIKQKRSLQEIKNITTEMVNFTNVNEISEIQTLEALSLISKYKLSFYDALIIASALDSNCSICYSEDLHNGLTINKKIKIINPF